MTQLIVLTCFVDGTVLAKLCRPRNLPSEPASTASSLPSTHCNFSFDRFTQETLHGNTRRRTQNDQGQGGQVRRPALHGHARQGAARHRAEQAVHQRQVRVRPRVRRLVDRRMEGHPGLGHAADARSRDRAHRPVHGRDDAAHHVRRDRAVRRQGLRARSALARQARRGVSEVVRARRHRVLRPRARVLRLRLGRVERRHVGQLRQDFVGGGAVVVGREVRRRQHGASAADQGRLLSGAAGRFAAGHPLRDVPCAWSRWASKSKCITTKSPRPASARSAPSSRRW